MDRFWINDAQFKENGHAAHESLSRNDATTGKPNPTATTRRSCNSRAPATAINSEDV
jgi:hypothetical protein